MPCPLLWNSVWPQMSSQPGIQAGPPLTPAFSGWLACAKHSRHLEIPLLSLPDFNSVEWSSVISERMCRSFWTKLVAMFTVKGCVWCWRGCMYVGRRSLVLMWDRRSQLPTSQSPLRLVKGQKWVVTRLGRVVIRWCECKIMDGFCLLFKGNVTVLYQRY